MEHSTVKFSISFRVSEKKTIERNKQIIYVVTYSFWIKLIHVLNETPLKDNSVESSVISFSTLSMQEKKTTETLVFNPLFV